MIGRQQRNQKKDVNKSDRNAGAHPLEKTFSLSLGRAQARVFQQGERIVREAFL